MDAPIDYHVFETLSTSCEKYTKDITTRSDAHVFVKLYRDGLSAIGTLPPHLLETITYLATHMDTKRQGYLSSWTLARDLGISRDTAISRLKELCGLRVGRGAVVRYSKVRRGWNKPIYYIYTLGDDLPFEWNCERSERPFVKIYIEQTKELIKHLEPELWATLLVMGMQMTSDRLCRASLERLSSQMGIAASSVSERLKRLSDGGWIERISTPGNQVAIYRLSMSVPIGFGAEDTWVDELHFLSDLVSLDNHLSDDGVVVGESSDDLAVSGSPPCLNKIERVKELTTPGPVKEEPSTLGVVVKTQQKGGLVSKHSSRRRHVGGGLAGNEEKDSQSWKAGSKNESCQVQDPSAPATNEDRGGSEPVLELDFVTNNQMDCEMDSQMYKAEIRELNRLCGRSNVQRWLVTVGVARLVEVYKASGSARRSRGGWIRKAIEDDWTIESSSSSGSQTHGSASRCGREQPPETGAQFYKMDHKASTLRAAELAGIELDEDDLGTSQPVRVGSIRNLRAALR
nr:hypothetical protein [Ferrimicrobium acidiphilum]